MAAVLLALAAGAWFYRDRLPGRLGHLATATPAPALSPSVAPPSAPPSVTTASVPAEASPPGAPLSPVPATTMPALARPAPAPSATRPAAAPTATPAAAPASDARALLRAGRYPEAARAFASATRAAGKGAAVVQLLIACSTETIQKAVDNASAPELLILPVNFKGRDCYRLCWGLYPSESRASAGVRSVPDYFRNGGATPKVLTASEVAP